MSRLRFLLIGAGSIGRRHARNLLDLGAGSVAFLRRHADPVEGVPEATIFTDAEVAAAEHPDAVLICSPTARHAADLTFWSGRTPKVFLEKPVAVCEAELPETVDTARIMVGFDLRFEPGFLVLMDWLQAGRIGRVLSVQAQVGQYLPDWHPGEDYRHGYSARKELGGGVLLDLIHEVDVVRQLAGPVDQVHAELSRSGTLEIDTEDLALLQLRHLSGALSSIHLDYLQREYSRTLRVIGTEGTVEMDWARGSLIVRVAGEEPELFHWPSSNRNARDMAQMQRLVDWVGGGHAPPAGWPEGLAALRIADAARIASDTGTRQHVRDPSVEGEVV